MPRTSAALRLFHISEFYASIEHEQKRTENKTSGIEMKFTKRYWSIRRHAGGGRGTLQQDFGKIRLLLWHYLG